MTRLLIVPGLSGSGPEHWQTAWERLDARCRRVEQSDWENPDLSAWLANLERAISASTEPAVLVAHSLGAALVAHWGQSQPRDRVLAALLVAPADVDTLVGAFPGIQTFAPLPTNSLPFPSLVVASRNDPYVSFERAVLLAEAWGSRFADLGELGHINAESKLGTWPRGRALLAELLHDCPFDLDPRLANDTVVVAESELSLLLLMNERRYPWLILVPRRSGLTELDELSARDRGVLAEESSAISAALRAEFGADKINVAALGNVVRQYHLHHVVRTLGDPAWPGPVWGHSPREPYDRPRARANARAPAAQRADSALRRFASVSRRRARPAHGPPSRAVP